MFTNTKEIIIKTEYITLGALLKFIGIISQGAEASFFLNKNKVLVNEEHETRRGRKIYPTYSVSINNEIYLIVSEKE